jgi:uncharacterized phage-associated protein
MSWIRNCGVSARSFPKVLRSLQPTIPTVQETIDAVLDYYGDKHPQWLSDLTHAEAPWKDARGDLPSGAACQNEITHEAMVTYYEALPEAA